MRGLCYRFPVGWPNQGGTGITGGVSVAGAWPGVGHTPSLVWFLSLTKVGSQARKDNVRSTTLARVLVGVEHTVAERVAVEPQAGVPPEVDRVAT